MIQYSFFGIKKALLGQARRCAAEERLAQIHRQPPANDGASSWFNHGTFGGLTRKHGEKCWLKHEKSWISMNGEFTWIYMNLPWRIVILGWPRGCLIIKNCYFIMKNIYIYINYINMFYHEKGVVCHNTGNFIKKFRILIVETGDTHLSF